MMSDILSRLDRFAGAVVNPPPPSATDDGPEPWLWPVFAATLVVAANAFAVWHIDLAWHDDVTSYAHHVIGIPTPRGFSNPRHGVLDSIQYALFSGASPLTARMFVILAGGLPAVLLGYAVARTIFGFRRPFAALFATTPYLTIAQYEIFVGVNLSYIVFDFAALYACLMIVAILRDNTRISVSAIGAITIAGLIIHGTITDILFGPAIAILSIFILRGSIIHRLMMTGSAIAASYISIQKQLLSQRAHDIPLPQAIEASITNLGRTANQFFIGDQTLAWVILGTLTILLIAAGIYSLLRFRWSGAIVPITFGIFVFGSILMYCISFTWFPNRYGFIAVAGFGLGMAWFLDATARLVAEAAPEQTAKITNDILAALVALLIAFLAYTKAQGLPQVRYLHDFTQTVRAYLAGGAYGARVERGVQFQRLQAANQLMIITDGPNPIQYKHTYPSLGFVRFVTGRRTEIMGWSGEGNRCSDPFAPWTHDWQQGPAGFTPELPIRVVGFRRNYGSGTEVEYMLRAPERALETAEGAANPWQLYQLSGGTPQVVSEGRGSDALRVELNRLGLTPLQVALNCGISL